MKESEVKSFSLVRIFATAWTLAYQAPPSSGFSRQEYWNGLAFPSPGDLPDPGIKPGSPALQADFLPSEPPGKLLITSTEWGYTQWGRDNKAMEQISGVHTNPHVTLSNTAGDGLFFTRRASETRRRE